MDIDDTSYVNSHGAKPKGKGRYAFSTMRYPLNDQIFFTVTATVSEAKRKAKREARKLFGLGNSVTIYLVP